MRNYEKKNGNLIQKSPKCFKNKENHSNICIFQLFIVILQRQTISMGQLAFIKTFILVTMPIDANDNRRHVHVFKKGGRHRKSVAKIWIESNGAKCIEIAESELNAKENNMIVNAIDKHWNLINDQITLTFRGEKTELKNIGK